MEEQARLVCAAVFKIYGAMEVRDGDHWESMGSVSGGVCRVGQVFAMSNKQDWVAEALARCEAATPGPWDDVISSETVRTLRGGEDDYVCDLYKPNHDANGDFIAAARTDLPRALAAVQAADALAEAIHAYDDTQRTDAIEAQRYAELHAALAAYRETRK